MLKSGDTNECDSHVPTSSILAIYGNSSQGNGSYHIALMFTKSLVYFSILL